MKEGVTQGGTLERWYTVRELVELTGFSKSAINAAIRSGRLVAKSPNGGTRYRMVSTSAWLNYIGSLS